MLVLVLQITLLETIFKMVVAMLLLLLSLVKMVVVIEIMVLLRLSPFLILKLLKSPPKHKVLPLLVTLLPINNNSLIGEIEMEVLLLLIV